MATFHKIYGPARPGIASRTKLPPLVQGSRDTLYLAWLNLDGTAFDLSSASAITATFYREHAASTVYAADGVFAVTSGADGQLTWALGAGDVGQAGTFYFFIEAVIGGLPVVAGPVQVEVVANPDATAVAPEAVTGISAAEAAYLTALVAAIPDAGNVASLDDIPAAAPAAYGAMWAEDITQTVAITATHTYFPIAGNLNAGELSSFTFQNASELVCGAAGTYLINWSLSISGSASDATIEGAPMVNGAALEEGSNATRAKENGVVYSVGGSTIAPLLAGDVVQLAVECENRTLTITMNHANLTAVRLGD